MLFFALILFLVVLVYFRFMRNNINPPQAKISSNNTAQNTPAETPPVNIPQTTPSDIAAGLSAPIDRTNERVTKKPFGIYITPQASLVQPERFSGYHTGTDFETFPEEANLDVTIKAICSGNLIAKRTTSGYGGVAIQSCMINNSSVTVLYGHLELASIIPGVGQKLNPGDTIGILGKGYSPETDGERKHLHLGIHKGTGINYFGYVQNKNELSDWIDSCLYICQ